jgi:ribokinase
VTRGVCVVGSFVYDLSVTVPVLPRRGESVLGSDLRAQPGGKGFNQAIAAARAGAPTSIVGRVGTDSYGDAFVATLAADGVDGRGVSRDPLEPTGLGFPFVESSTGDNAIVVVLGANATLSSADVDAASAEIAGAAVVLLQFEVPLAANVRAAQLARASGALAILNPAPAAAVPSALAAHLDLVVTNLVEAQTLLDSVDTSPEHLVARLREHLGVPRCIVTLGEDGAVVADDDGVRRHPAPRVDCVDSVGAGDTFCGYLAAHLAAGDDIDTAVTWACGAGAQAVTRRGAAAAVPSAEDVAALLGEGASPVH